MRGAGAAATAGGRARGAKDQESEIDEEQQEARQEVERALAGGRSGRQRGGESGERKKKTKQKNDRWTARENYRGVILETLLSLIRACCCKTGQGGYSRRSCSSFLFYFIFFPRPASFHLAHT